MKNRLQTKKLLKHLR